MNTVGELFGIPLVSTLIDCTFSDKRTWYKQPYTIFIYLFFIRSTENKGLLSLSATPHQSLLPGDRFMSMPLFPHVGLSRCGLPLPQSMGMPLLGSSPLAVVPKRKKKKDEKRCWKTVLHSLSWLIDDTPFLANNQYKLSR